MPKNSCQLSSSSQSLSRLSRLSRVGMISPDLFCITVRCGKFYGNEGKNTVWFSSQKLAIGKVAQASSPASSGTVSVPGPAKFSERSSRLKSPHHPCILLTMNYLAEAKRVFDIELAAL